MLVSRRCHLPGENRAYSGGSTVYSHHFTSTEEGLMESIENRGARISPLRAAIAAAILLAAGSFSDAHAQAGRIYWTDSNNSDTAVAQVLRVDFDGAHVQPLVVPGSLNPRFLALDVEGGKMYWTDIGRIDRANLDGTGRTTLVSGFYCPMGIALDVTAGKIYWSDCVEARIMRANLTDGSGVEQVIGGLSEPRGLALDLVHGKMYWTDTGTRKVHRANLDGTARENLVTGLFPQGIALDVEAGTMYWPDNIEIRRANLDGTAAATIVSNAGNPIGIAFDRARRKLYWTEAESNSIVRASLDGTSWKPLSLEAWTLRGDSRSIRRAKSSPALTPAAALTFGT
jgi:DNA-binding beta-propeller fold protein YncE